MASRLFKSQDFCSGCAFTAFGVVTVVLAQSHALGTAARMGPGYFPTVLGVLLSGIGVVMLVRSVVAAVADGEAIGRIDVWLLARLLLAVAAFALLLNPLGLVLTAIIVVVVASWAGHEFRLGEALINAGTLALLSYLMFIRALGQTMPVWPWFISD
jgi:Tripartite tricarboxylate transporter TctB family